MLKIIEVLKAQLPQDAPFANNLTPEDKASLITGTSTTNPSTGGSGQNPQQTVYTPSLKNTFIKDKNNWNNVQASNIEFSPALPASSTNGAKIMLKDSNEKGPETTPKDIVYVIKLQSPALVLANNGELVVKFPSEDPIQPAWKSAPNFSANTQQTAVDQITAKPEDYIDVKDSKGNAISSTDYKVEVIQPLSKTPTKGESVIFKITNIKTFSEATLTVTLA